MPKFESPLGSKQFQGPTMRDFSVPDEGDLMPPGPPPQHRQTRSMEAPTFDAEELREFQNHMQPPPPAMREMTNVEQQILNAKRVKREGKERLSDGARRRIEMLVGMTRLNKTIDINGTTFVLQALSNKEVREALVAAADYDGTVQFSFEYSKQLLARSIVQIAGTEVDQFLNSTELSVKLFFVEELPQALFTRLYNEYIALDTEARDKFAMKTAVEVKEVVEDLKK